MQDQPVLFVKVSETRWETVDAAFDGREWPERAESTATGDAACRQIKASVDSSVPVGGTTQ